jgi:hypothetical protein
VPRNAPEPAATTPRDPLIRNGGAPKTPPNPGTTTETPEPPSGFEPLTPSLRDNDTPRTSRPGPANKRSEHQPVPAETTQTEGALPPKRPQNGPDAICERCWAEPADNDELGRWLCADCHTEGLDLPHADLEAA